MSVGFKTYYTYRFLERWPYIGLASSMLALLALIIAPLFARTLLNETAMANVGEPVTVAEFTLKPQMIGALRVDVIAFIQTNQWVTYEIQLLDRQGKLMASAIKEAWKESGTWREGGESGTWSEQDLQGGLDVRVKEEEKVTLILNVLGYGTGKTDIDSSVPFQVKVKNGAVDTRHLWSGFWGSLALGLMALMAVPQIGKKAMTKKINDSDPTVRGTVGGVDKLVRVNVDVESDETSPGQLQVQLFINNSYGEQIYATSETMKLNFKSEDGKIEAASGSIQKFFLLDVQDCYGFHVKVFPDAPIDRTTLKVRDGVRTRTGVDVIHIHSDAT